MFVPRKQKQVEKFWNKNFRRVKSWYLAQKQDCDVIVSASPQYLVQVACDRLGVKCIASQVDISTGKSLCKHCHGKAKVEQFCQRYANTPLATYYSDSLSDVPMFKYAQRGYYVKGDTIILLYENGDKVK